jgi:hypothetical protein
MPPKNNWISKTFNFTGDFWKLSNPRIFSRAFGLKEPFAFCANEDCIYKREIACPAEDGKNECPNKSSLDYNKGCRYFYGKPYQHAVLENSFRGDKLASVIITGRGTGKSAVIDAQKAIMECTIMPYIRGLLFRTSIPVPSRVIVAGNTKDTALLLTSSINHILGSSELLTSFIDQKENTKTHKRFKNGSELFVKTVGTDARQLRGFHADIMKNIYKEAVKSTMIAILDEGCFNRAPRAITEVVRPTMQLGNCFSHLFCTSTPWAKGGEVYDLVTNPGDIVNVYNFASYHNRYTNLKLLLDLRRRLEAAGLASIFNREVLGLFESDEGLFFPFEIWAKGIDDNLDWMDIEVIQSFENEIPGRYFLGVDPNKFRQLESGDFASYLLMSVSGDRKYVRMISRGKYKLDLEDTFLDKIDKINKVFKPRVICDGNSGMVSKLRNMGMDVLPGRNDPVNTFNAMSLLKLDIIDKTIKMPSCNLLEDERRTYVIKDPDTSVNVPKLDHIGEWGQGNTSDLMDCAKYCYQGMMEDFGIGELVDTAVASSESVVIQPPTAADIFTVENTKNLDLVVSSRNRLGKIK